MMRLFEVTTRELVAAREKPEGPRITAVQVARIPEHLRSYMQAKLLVLELVEACRDCNTVYEFDEHGNTVEACDCPPF